MFVLIAIALATISEGLRTAWERAVAAERAKDLLLHELGHRTKDNLTMAISLLSLQARSQHNPEVKAVLQNVVSRIHAIAGAHEHFEAHDHEGGIDMHDYLQKLCGHLGENLRDIRPIAVAVEAEKAELRAEQAIPLGLIVNELVTNALKYAFPDDRAGSVRVTFNAGLPLALTVEDDGIGCSPTKHDGMGSRLVRLLVQQLGGTIDWEDHRPGCRVRIAIPSGRDRGQP